MAPGGAHLPHRVRSAALRRRRNAPILALALALALVAVLALAGGAARAQEARSDARPEPPTMGPLRYDESYGYLRDPAVRRGGVLERLKYLPLEGDGEDGDRYLTLGAEVRLRYVWDQEPRFGELPDDDSGYLLARAHPLADLHLGPRFRAFAQLQSALVLDYDLATTSAVENRLDLLQGFVDLGLPVPEGAADALVLRAGRQALRYGAGRLIDLSYVSPVLRPFDAAKLSLRRGPWTVDALYARPVETRVGVFEDRLSHTRSLWTLYGVRSLPDLDGGLDLYVIGSRIEDAIFEQGAGEDLRHTFGARLHGTRRGLDWDCEVMLQAGRFDGPRRADVLAWAASLQAGYTFERRAARPRLAMTLNLIGGDADPEDGELGTFHPLFTRATYFGELVPLAPSNLIHLSPNLGFELGPKLDVTAYLSLYWRFSDDDAVYGFGGNVLREDSGSDARFIGAHPELWITYQVDRHLSLFGFAALFAPGTFLEHTGSHETNVLLGLQAMWRF